MNEFPKVVKERLDIELEQAILARKKDYDDRQKAIENEKRKKPDKSNYTLGFGCLGTIIFFPIGAILGYIIGRIIYKNVLEKYEREVFEIDGEMKRLADELDCSIENLRNEYTKKYNDYVKSFENDTQQRSIQLAESSLAKEVIDWMTEGFSKAIDAADRSSHIQVIDVPFVFNVYRDKITCNLGTYDFEIKRCDNLTSPVEQSALAIAIASAMQVSIIMKYPKDVSGTDVSINIGYDYTAECSIAKITYVAANGNYQAKKSW